MEERTRRLIEYTVEALLVAWLSYLFFYQNYLLYRWHRGLPLPSKWPFFLAGVLVGALLFWYEWNKFQMEEKSVAPVESEEHGSGTSAPAEESDFSP
ncbi:hypothetical protein CL1_1650 [Thermococcus cleftensis]|uniref:Uncharacterized protein n=1 Tax=Thermococcus cleftensis (strain DSM 27260 / KACC 17922 / CL1) TaxID=163003 RepID=I3ZVW3_THECF|nr:MULTISPECIES: membrane protein [Thermococcus]AFL95847.1 hypothetical protein CL1_1650 [Thermococcus cleftensis]NJE02659.1 hypothetical protein [Thermococcus sp. MV11]